MSNEYVCVHTIVQQEMRKRMNENLQRHKSGWKGPSSSQGYLRKLVVTGKQVATLDKKRRTRRALRDGIMPLSVLDLRDVMCGFGKGEGVFAKNLFDLANTANADRARVAKDSVPRDDDRNCLLERV